ncbi:MAG: prmA 2 [Proteobacteria bacterium]|nr:prmA 2 [Pseudomonadota bacterium]
MRQYQLHIPATDAMGAETIADAIEAAFVEAGPVSWYETDGGWAVDGFFFADAPDEILATARTALEGIVDGQAVTVEPVPEDVDWVAQSLEGLSPVVAGRFVVHGAHDRDHIPKGLIGLQIEANQAFGTGHHPTTWGCLTALSRLLAVYRFENVFDLGTGSGVLAIGIALATKRPVLASDIDPLAVKIALENAEINGAANLVTAVTAAGFAHPAIVGRKFDLIVANILADPLKMLSPQFRVHAMQGAAVVLSGILRTQAESVLAAFRAQGFVRERHIVKDVWSTLVLRYAG